MTSDQDKLIQVGGQLLHQWRHSSVEVAQILFAGVLVTGVLAGTVLAVWIFRGGLSQRPLRG